MSAPEPSFSIKVDLINPGQFFACCGLLELAHRLWPGAEGWFGAERFHIAASAAGADAPVALISRLREAPFGAAEDGTDPKTCPLRLGEPFDLRLDWWLDDAGVGGSLKTWAGQQSVLRIAGAMRQAVPLNPDDGIFDCALVVTEPTNKKKIVEPFYFDARRFAPPLDVGFSLDIQDAQTAAYPAVELLCLIALQRFRPAPTTDRWTFEYSAWSAPLPVSVASAAVCGMVPDSRRYRFKLLFRDDQKRYKGFGLAVPIGGES